MDTFISMIFPLISFIVLVLIMAKLLYKPVQRILKNRADRVEQDMQDAADKSAKAQELYLEYEQKVKDIESERTAILDATRKQANDHKVAILEAAKIEAQELKDRASRDINTERERIKEEVHQAIVEISTDMAEKLISVNIDKNAHSKLFAEAMADLESTAFKPVEQTA
jgi:F-type H+-transporting ATPase subunit b